MASFEKNREKWSQIDPRRSLMLPYLAVKTKAPEPQGDGKKWFKKLELKDVEVLFVYGAGSGEYYEAVKGWLKKDKKRSLIILEDSLEIIYHLFHTKAGTALLHDEQVRLFYFERFEEVKDILLMLAWEFLMKKLAVVSVPAYQKAKKEMSEQLHHRILHDATLHNSIVEEYLKYGAGFFKNFYPNILAMPGAYLGTSLFGKFKNVPAIICGAGPSLSKQLPLLGTLKDKALIFGGGSSLNALNAAGIIPHFGAGIDPNPTQLERILTSHSKDLPFFFRNRMQYQALQAIKGPKLYIPGSGGYDTAEWFETELGIERGEILDEGYNVINFCVEIARAMGCSPIIFVGVDLAYTGMQSYANGVVADNQVKKKEILKGSDFDLVALKRKDIKGNPIYTLWKWISESEWIGQYAEDHPEIKLINATEGGLGFPGVSNQSLKAVVKKYLTRKYDFPRRIKKGIESGALPKITRRKVLNLIKTLQKSMETSQKHLEVLLEEVNAMREKLMNLDVVDKSLNLLSGRAALYEMDLAEEVAYKYVLDVFNEVFARITYHETQRLANLPEKEKKLGQLAVNAKRITFLIQVAAVQQELIRMALKQT